METRQEETEKLGAEHDIEESLLRKNRTGFVGTCLSAE
jgi:hypothetical protein